MYDLDSRLMHSVENLSKEVFSLSNWLTKNPEISGEEEKSCKKITTFLQEHGYEIESPYGGIAHSFRAYLPSDDPSLPKIAIMTEYDALPEVGHACGHSLSAGISILTALALKDSASDLQLNFELVGTPAEESIGGKIIMANNGAFDRYSLAIMNHLDNVNAPLARLLASSDMYITFTGKAAHASGNPWDGINAFNASQLFFHATDMLRQHLEPGFQLHGIITKCGEAPNIVPENVEMDVYLRSLTINGLERLTLQLENCVKGAAIATGCSYDIKQRWGTYGDIFYPKSAEKALTEVMESLKLPVHIYDEPSGSSDVGNVDIVTPTLSLYVKATDNFIPLHNKEFVDVLYGERGMKTLLDGSNTMAQFLLRCGKEPELFKEIKNEWKEYRTNQ